MNHEIYNQKRINIIADKIKKLSNLSLSYEVQESHFIVPADNLSLIEKALETGCSKAEEQLFRNGISLEDVEKVLEMELDQIRNIITNSPFADLVLLDGEDATDLKEESIKRARSNVIETLNKIKVKKSRIFYRPSGIELDYFLDDVHEVLSGLIITNGSLPLDGLVFPKLETEQEASLIMEILNNFESKNNLEQNTLKVQFLVESAAGVENLYKIAETFSKRLTGIIFGMADYASEIGISSLNENNPVFQYAKIKIINTSKIFRIPAIDCMSFNYPVADKSLSIQQNKEKILSSMKYLHDVFLFSTEIGMDGKWVGHPLQLLALKIAAEKKFNKTKIENFLEKLKLYSDSISGATMIHGEMADRATNRNIKSFLRKATVRKKIDSKLALDLGIISELEFKSLGNIYSH